MLLALVGAFGGIKSFCHLHLPQGRATWIYEISIKKLPTDNFESLLTFFQVEGQKGVYIMEFKQN